MKAELEQLAACDEKSRAVVQTAEAEAADILSRARAEAEKLQSGIEARLELIRNEEIQPLIREAEKKARQRERDARTYMDRLRARVSDQRESIVDTFIFHALDGLWPPTVGGKD